MTVVAIRRDNKQLREEIALMSKAAQRISKNPEEARRFLIKAGIVTKSGKLTKRYGG